MANVEWLSSALGLGLNVADVNPPQMVLRTCIIYLFTLFALKLGKRRFLGKNSPFDIVVMIVIGSVMSRAINGNAPFVPTLASCIALILAHRLVAWFTSRLRFIARMLEGEPRTLVDNGRIDWEAMRQHDITEHDLHSALRELTHTDQLQPVKAIVLEPNGKLSVVMK